jgi:hypothetical protein
MARSHHRKSHKQHLQHFKHKEGADTKAKPKAKTAGVFGIIGLVLGLAVGYIATSGSTLWMGVFAVAFGAAGYFVGQKVDQG